MAKRAVKICKEADCKNEQTTIGYCRLHYLKNWKKIREKQKKKAAASLNKYVEHIMRKRPDDFVDAVKEDLRHAGRFEKRAEQFLSDDDYHDILEEIDMVSDVESLVDNLKVDETF